MCARSHRGITASSFVTGAPCQRAGLRYQAPMNSLSPLFSAPPASGGVRPPVLSLAARITLLLLLVVVLTSSGLAWFSRQTVLDTFAAKEVDLVLQNRKILEQAIAAKLEFLEASTTDWAACRPGRPGARTPLRGSRLSTCSGVPRPTQPVTMPRAPRYCRSPAAGKPSLA